MPIAITTGFVDRKPELALFGGMLAGETDERILLILEAGEQGKTYLLLRLFDECEQQRPPVPVVLLDFDQRRSGLTGYLSVAREVRRDWVTLEIPPLEQWEASCRWLSREQRERIEEADFFELLQREIPKRLLAL